ncbi:MAG: hypothetical protein K8I03_10880 [Ignavibacteria bacterium]|nr:hypothetical protein [Ignavibacteria bacterium]
MPNLFWKNKSSKTLNLVPKPFVSEEDFEKTVFDTKELLQDISLLRRQIRGGKKTTRPDMIGIDTNGNVCIIEMKNVNVNAEIIPQVLDYAIWAESNPDSIKNLWLERDEQIDEIDIDWDNYTVRIIIIAPTIDQTTLKMINRIRYDVDLIEITRWVEKNNEFMLVNNLKPEVEKRTKTTRGLMTYDRSFYESTRNKQSVRHFLKFCEETEKIVKKKKWPLEMKYNAFYCGFKLGFFNAFSIKWIGTKTFAFYIKIPLKVAEKFQPKGIKMEKYSTNWNSAVYYIDPEKTKLHSFIPLLEKAYKELSGS